MKRFILSLALLLPATLPAQNNLTLEECRDLAIKNNKELRISNERVKIAEYEKKSAITKYFPQLSATGAYLWNEKDIYLLDATKLGPLATAVPPTLLEELRLDIQNIWIGNISLVQPVFMGGKIVSYNQIAKYSKLLAESMNDQTLQEIIYKTDETYWQVVSLVNKKKLADSYVDLLRRMESDVAHLVKEGLATKTDELTVRVKLNEAEMAQTKVDNGLSLSRMLLSQICGLSLDEPISLYDESLEDLQINQGNTIADINEAFINRSELRSLDYVTKIYKEKESLVLSDMLPNLALTANYLATSPNSFNGFNHDFKGMFNVGVAMQIPLSGWWEGSFKRNAARAETHIKKLETEDAREKIELQVNQSVYKVNEAKKKLIASTQNKESAEENLKYADYGFKEGVIPSLNLMEAQTAWVSAHSDFIDAQIEMKLSEVYLSKALGKLAVE